MQQNRRLLGQLDDFDQDVAFGVAAKSGQQNVVVNDGTVDREITVNIISKNSFALEDTVKVQTLEKGFS